MFILMQPPNNSDEEAITISHAVVSAVHWAAMFRVRIFETKL
jgi:hypothetical protein